MQSKVILPMLLGILVVGIAQTAFGQEVEKTPFIAVDEVEFQQPESKYNYQELTIIGFVENYNRGEEIVITITYPDKTIEEINTYASKKGEIYTLLHVTQDSQIGKHLVTLNYYENSLSTSFDILENQ
ncbi:hypothetical protein C5F47_03710 [Nitrosopumilus cobalaminigenes]|uniref:DUF3244 domain-containing protein n=1 Tax=Nitrosopumilus cobalaminigenes TaxID=1470066 RepID=A0A7D5R7J6_9ARCH|nr:hypothetical protein [Nitrosopumilus cobalaminigenes]QLH02723.1 hypothetical protein C5F47_03710 [Nitrosopumilus cobalaminigenes]